MLWALNVMFVAVCVAAPGATFAAPLFAPQMEFRTGANPYSIAAADLNLDGIVDLVVANNGPNNTGNSVSILYGNGDGTFQPQVQLKITDVEPVVRGPYGVATGDLNEDGRPDLLVLKPDGAQALSIFIGKSDNTFEAASVYQSGTVGLQNFAVADMNGDGHLDVVAAGAAGSRVFIWHGDGHGSFGEPVSVQGNGSYAIAIGDADEDGHPDVVTTNFEAAVAGAQSEFSFMKGIGDSLDAPRSYSCAQFPRNVAIGDLDRDGHLDVVTASVAPSSSYGLNLFRGAGNGTFALYDSINVYGFSPEHVDIADLNGDGIPDLVTNSNSTSAVYVILGKGGGQFAAPIEFPLESRRPFDVIAADLNRDGRADLAVTNLNFNTVSVFLNSGCGPLSQSISLVFPNRGGDGGDIPVNIYGCGFEAGAVPKLRRLGEPDIIGSQVTLSADGVLGAKFHLTGRTQGAWDVVVENSDHSVAIRTASFTIEPARAPSIWAQTFGRTMNRVGTQYADVIKAGNSGNYATDPWSFVCIDNESCVNEGKLRYIYQGAECDITDFSSPSKGLFTLPWNLTPGFKIEPIYTVRGHVAGTADCCRPECRPEGSEVATTVFQALAPATGGSVIADQEEGKSEGLLYRFWKKICPKGSPHWPSRACDNTSRLRAVWGAGPTDVFAVGEGGTIAHYNGQAWELMPLPDCLAPMNLFGVWGYSGTDVYAVGDRGTVLHYDGACWKQETHITNVRLLGVWGTSGTVYVVGGDVGANASGILLAKAGGVWSTQPIPANTGVLYGVFGVGQDVYAVGVNGTVLQSSQGWQTMSTDANTQQRVLVSIWGTATNDLYAVGNTPNEPANFGTIHHWDGTLWRQVGQTSQDLWIQSIWGTAANNLIVVGDGGTILNSVDHGGNWTPMPGSGNQSPYLFGVWGSANNDVWAVGDGGPGAALHFDASGQWAPISPCIDTWYTQRDAFPAALSAAVETALQNLNNRFTSDPCNNTKLAFTDELILEVVDQALTALGNNPQFSTDVGMYRRIFDTIWPAPAPHRAEFMNGLKDLAKELATCHPFDGWTASDPSREPRICSSSCDPNAKTGPAGAGPGGYVQGNIPLNYAVYFENLETAPLAASEVVVTDQLDPARLDFSTFTFGPIAFGTHTITPPPGVNPFQTDVDLRPDQNLKVRIIGQLNTTTGLLTVRFQSLDPVTGLDPEDQTIGFLPPDVNSPEGEGSVSLSAMPRTDLPDGTVITNEATIVFDTNAPIPTNQPTNTLDSGKPSSHVDTLSPVPGDETRIVAQWSGTDGFGSGIRDYSIFVSDNGGPYALRARSSAQQDTFPVQDGHTYGFYSVARDLVGNEEAAPSPLVADATITIRVVVGCPVAMGFDFTPNTLNLRSMGHWVTGYLEPPAPLTPGNIDIASIRLNGTVKVDSTAATAIGDHDGDGIPDLMVKFNRAAVELTGSDGDSVPVTVKGMVGGQCFQGADTIRVLRAVVSAPAAGSALPPGMTTTVRWTTPSGVQIQSVALLSSVDDGATWNLDAQRLPNSGSAQWVAPSVTTDKAKVAVVLVESADATGYFVDGVLGTSGTFIIANAAGVDGGGKVEFALRVVRPNPTTQDLRVNFGLPEARPAKIEVFNVSGRLVASREVGSLGIGFHTMTLVGRATLPSGVYIVRLTQGGKRLTTRAVLVR